MKFDIGDNVRVSEILLKGFRGRIVENRGKQGYGVKFKNINDTLYFREFKLELDVEE